MAFWTPVRREAVLDDTGGAIKIVNCGEGFPVELPTEVLLAATNCDRADWACALLEVAIAAGATSMLVIANVFWKGGPRRVPSICAETLVWPARGAFTRRPSRRNSTNKNYTTRSRLLPTTCARLDRGRRRATTSSSRDSTLNRPALTLCNSTSGPAVR